MFQELSEAKGVWDHPIEGRKFVDNLKEVNHYFTGKEEQVVFYELHGFCDASIKAYAAVVYLRNITPTTCYVRLVILKARMGPSTKQTIPRLELLSALVLPSIMSVTVKAIIGISKVKCWTDTEVALFLGFT